MSMSNVCDIFTKDFGKRCSRNKDKIEMRRFVNILQENSSPESYQLPTYLHSLIRFKVKIVLSIGLYLLEYALFSKS